MWWHHDLPDICGFYLVNLEPNLKKLALEQNNNRMTEEAVESWLLKKATDARSSSAMRNGSETPPRAISETLHGSESRLRRFSPRASGTPEP